MFKYDAVGIDLCNNNLLRMPRHPLDTPLDPWVRCPNDATHWMPRSRYARHMSKCDLKHADLAAKRRRAAGYDGLAMQEEIIRQSLYQHLQRGVEAARQTRDQLRQSLACAEASVHHAERASQFARMWCNLAGEEGAAAEARSTPVTVPKNPDAECWD